MSFSLSGIAVHSSVGVEEWNGTCDHECLVPNGKSSRGDNARDSRSSES
jgi:hypothetical protein